MPFSIGLCATLYCGTLGPEEADLQMLLSLMGLVAVDCAQQVAPLGH